MGGLAHGCFWIDNATFPEQEIAVRFHHKLVYIHPFPNGNGRISRLMADLLSIQICGAALFLGSANLVEISVIRTRYIEALRQADRGDYSALLAFTTPPEARR
ncbi:MAG TPA: Fic family protein [Treponemataceae bacterium]|nr:Fic family protein [Treponemataceae bacterium]